MGKRMIVESKTNEKTELECIHSEVKRFKALHIRRWPDDLKERIVQYYHDSAINKRKLEDHLGLSNGIVRVWEKSLGLPLPTIEAYKKATVKKEIDALFPEKKVLETVSDMIDVKYNGIEISVKISQLASVVKTLKEC